MYILHSGTLPLIEKEGNRYRNNRAPAFAGRNADLTEYFRFMEWMGIEENYRKFFNGVEGTDYTLGRHGRINIINEDRRLMSGFTVIFGNNALNSVSNVAPHNYEMAIENYQFTKEIYLTNAMLGPNWYDEFIREYDVVHHNNQHGDVWNEIYGPNRPAPGNVAELIREHFNTIHENYHPLLRQYANQMNEVMQSVLGRTP
jgi:hypothetical protein